MKHNLTSRILAAMILGFLLWQYSQFYYLRWHQRGQDAFMAYELHRYDRYMAIPHTSITLLFAALFLAALLLGAYELLAAGILAAITSSKKQVTGPPKI